jgi:hypothetical protein
MMHGNSNIKKKLKHTVVYFCLLIYVDVKLDLSHWEKNTGWGCPKMECCESYLIRRRRT